MINNGNTTWLHLSINYRPAITVENGTACFFQTWALSKCDQETWGVSLGYWAYSALQVSTLLWWWYSAFSAYGVRGRRHVSFWPLHWRLPCVRGVYGTDLLSPAYSGPQAESLYFWQRNIWEPCAEQGDVEELPHVPVRPQHTHFIIRGQCMVSYVTTQSWGLRRLDLKKQNREKKNPKPKSSSPLH